MLILQIEEGIPLYSNLIRGFMDRFIYRNPRINLHHYVSPANVPYHDPYLYPHFMQILYHRITLRMSSMKLLRIGRVLLFRAF